MEGFTTIEQSKKLLELGLSPESADMFWSLRHDYPTIIGDDYDNTPCYNDSDDNSDIPCWSLQSLLSIMPDYTLQGDAEYCFIVCDTHRHSTSTYLDGFQINAAFEMVCWLLENGHI